MTAAQKTAKANFKKAIEYRKKTGVSLKEAFAHVYGKKVGAAPKKKATKKAAPKKAAKKVVKKAAPKKAAKKKHTKYGVVKKHVRRVAGVKKKVSEQSVLRKIHKVKDQVNQLDELQHKHMIGKKIKIGSMPIYKDKDAAREIQLYADNDSQLYYQRRNPILKNLSKKYLKGQYDIEKAAKLWRYYIDAALQKYHKEFGGRGSWSNLLSVPDRNLLATEYAKRTKEEFDLGNTY